MRRVVERNAGLAKADVANWRAVRAARAAESRAAILGVWNVGCGLGGRNGRQR